MPQQVELACVAADRGVFDTAHELASAMPPGRLEHAACRALVASIYRQLDRHDLAEPHDRAGAEAPVADALGHAMCRLGLVADAVGAGGAGVEERLLEAERALAEVEPGPWAVRWFDPWLTHAWVVVEVALLRDDPGRAVEVLEPFAARRPRGIPNTRWPHERAKTWLFLGVAQRCAGRSDDARASLERAVGISAGAALRPLLVPAVGQLAELDPAAAERWRPHVARATRVLRAHLPPGVAPPHAATPPARG